MEMTHNYERETQNDGVKNTTIDHGLSWLDKGLQIVERYKLKTIAKAFLVLTMIALFVGFLKNPTWVFERYDAWKEKEHTSALQQRLVNNEKLHITSEKLLYRVGADRVLVLELHNGLENANGLPFSKCSATYEALGVNTHPIAEQYQNVNLSLMPFVNTLFDQGYWCGDVEDLKELDRGLYYKMKSNYTEHFAACVIEGVDKPLAFLFISFTQPIDTTNHDCNMVRENIRHIALEQALLLELNKHGIKK